MITHIVFFKLFDRSPENIGRARQVLLSLRGRIPQLRHLEVGADVVRSPRSFDLALVARFESLEDLQAYQIHPEHVEASDYMSSVRESVASVDYESE